MSRETLTMQDPYKTLGLQNTASKDDVKKAYRRLAKQYHPDFNKSDPKAASKFQAVTEAYDIINDDKYNAADYQPAKPTNKQTSKKTKDDSCIYLNDLVLTVSMTTSYTGIAISNLPGGSFQLNPGFIGGSSWRLTRDIPVKFVADIYIVYKPQKGFTHIDHDLYTEMTVTRKEVKEKKVFNVPNHPNPDGVRVFFPTTIKGSTTVRVAGRGLPNAKGQFGDLVIDVTVIEPNYRYFLMGLVMAFVIALSCYILNL